VHSRHPCAQRKVVDENSVSVGQRVTRDVKCLSTVSERIECGRKIIGLPDLQHHYFETKSLSCGLYLVDLKLASGVTYESEYRQLAECRHEFTQNFEALARKVKRLERHAGNVATGTCHARDQALTNRVTRQREDNRYVRSRLLGYIASDRDDDVDLKPDELSRIIGIALATSFRPAIFNRDVPAFALTELVQPL
jgi:hypothetical protein